MMIRKLVHALFSLALAAGLVVVPAAAAPPSALPAAAANNAYDYCGHGTHTYPGFRLVFDAHWNEPHPGGQGYRHLHRYKLRDSAGSFIRYQFTYCY